MNTKLTLRRAWPLFPAVWLIGFYLYWARTPIRIHSTRRPSRLFSDRPGYAEALNQTILPWGVCRGYDDSSQKLSGIRCVPVDANNTRMPMQDLVLMVHDSRVPERHGILDEAYQLHEYIGLNVFPFSRFDLPGPEPERSVKTDTQVTEKKWSSGNAKVSVKTTVEKTVEYFRPVEGTFKRDGLSSIYGFFRARQQYPDAKWYIKTEDDGLVFIDHLTSLLSTFDHNKPYYFGFGVFNDEFYLQRKTWEAGSLLYASGKASYVLSAEAVERLTEGWCAKINPKDITSLTGRLTKYEDLNVAICLRDLEITLTPVYGFSPFDRSEWSACVNPSGNQGEKQCEHVKDTSMPLLSPPAEANVQVEPLSWHDIVPGSYKYLGTLPSLEHFRKIQQTMLRLARQDPDLTTKSKQKPRFLVFHAYPDAGLGNRLLALISSVIMAYLSNRALVVRWEAVASPTVHNTGEIYTMPPLEELVKFPKGMDVVLYPSDPANGYLNNCEQCTVGRIQDGSDIRTWTWASRANLIEHFPEDVLYLRTTTPFGLQLVDNPWYQRRLQAKFGDSVFQYFTNWFLQPSRQVLQHMQQFPQADLAMHIRRGAQGDSEKDMSDLELKAMIQCASDIVQEQAGLSKTPFKVMIATDTPSTKVQVANVLDTVPKVEVEYISDEGNTARGSLQGVKAAMSELYRLGQSKRLILNPRSTFGHMGSAMVSPSFNYDRLVRVIDLDGSCKDVIVPQGKRLCPVPLAEHRSELLKYFRRGLRPECALLQPKKEMLQIHLEEPMTQHSSTPYLETKLPKVGFLVVATGHYIRFVFQLIESAAKHLKNMDVYMIIATSVEDEKKWTPTFEKMPIKVVWIRAPTHPWPLASLMRFHSFLAAKKKIVKLGIQYLFAHDADMLWVNDVGQEMLADTVGVLHPGFFLLTGPVPVFENNPRSTAYIEPNDIKDEYFMGGMYGGRTEPFFEMLTNLCKLVDDDQVNNITAIWHDESYLNAHFRQFPPDLVLSPDYGMPQNLHEFPKLNITISPKLSRYSPYAPYPYSMDPKFLAIDKGTLHAKFRDITTQFDDEIE